MNHSSSAFARLGGLLAVASSLATLAPATLPAGIAGVLAFSVSAAPTRSGSA